MTCAARQKERPQPHRGLRSSLYRERPDLPKIDPHGPECRDMVNKRSTSPSTNHRERQKSSALTRAGAVRPNPLKRKLWAEEREDTQFLTTVMEY